MKIRLFLPFFFLIFLAGCSQVADKNFITADSTVRSDTIILGNHAYIPVNLHGRAADKPVFIMSLVNSFEKTYPEFKVTNWKIEEQQNAYVTSAYVYGIWIDFEERQSSPRQ